MKTSVGGPLFCAILVLLAGAAAAGEEAAARPPRKLDAAALAALAGEWEGTYWYPETTPQGLPTNRDPMKFSVVFTRHGDALTGRAREPNSFGKTEEPWLYANVVDVEMDDKGTLIFRKVYDGTAEVTHGVFYGGIFTPDKKTLTGTWWIPANWAGKFVMRKKP